MLSKKFIQKTLFKRLSVSRHKVDLKELSEFREILNGKALFSRDLEFGSPIKATSSSGTAEDVELIFM